MTSQQVQTCAPDAPLARVAGWWLAFSCDVDPERARQRFIARYGYEPRQLVRCGPLLLVGPVERAIDNTRALQA